MTRAEAVRILALLKAAFPYMALQDETAAVWSDRLTRFDVRSAEESVRWFADTLDDRRGPTLAAFAAEIRSRTRRPLELDEAPGVTYSEWLASEGLEPGGWPHAELGRVE